MPLTAKGSEVTQKLVDIIDAAKATYTPPVKRVYYGDQILIPDYPSVAVESDTKERPLHGTHHFKLTLRSLILVYHGAVQSTETTKKAVEQLTEQLEDTVHADFTLGGLVVYGHIIRVDHGVAPRETEMIRATRMIWEGTSRKTF